MQVLVLGATGQLGTHLRQRLPNAIFWTRQQADLARPNDLSERIITQQPDIVVNAAAYTAVDQAESEPDLAWRVNAEGPAHIARAARALGVPLIHISTDYVFDGSKNSAYQVDDPVCPTGVYGKTKLGGEIAVSTLCEKYWVLRTSWVFSEYGSNFVKTILRLAQEHSEIKIVSDQKGRPVYAGDLADLVAKLATQSNSEPVSKGNSDSRLPSGIYHTGGGPQTTWYGFALEIIEQAINLGLLEGTPSVVPVTTKEYPTAAQRPKNSVLQISEGFQQGLAVYPDWQKGLTIVLSKLKDREQKLP